MEYRYLGNSGIYVSRYCFGSLTLGPLCAALSVEEGSELMELALQNGVNFIDTAEYYQNYPHIYAALQKISHPEQVVIATKTFAESAQEASWAIEDARIALKRNVLDILLLHEIRDQEDFFSREDAWHTIKLAKKNGIIKAIGVSTHSSSMAQFFATNPDVDILHVLLNMSSIGILDGDKDDMLSAIQAAKAHGKGVYTMKSLGGGALMHNARAALAWSFAQPDVDSFAIGCRDKAELTTNLSWLAGQESPCAADIEHIVRKAVFDKEPRCHGCGRCVKKCATGAMSLDQDGMAIWQEERCLFCGYCIAACPWFCISFC